MEKEKSKEKLKNSVKDEVTQMFEAVLDYAQVACPSPDTFKALRSKVLRVGNNCIRNVHKNLDKYDIKYTAIAEDIIEVQQQKK